MIHRSKAASLLHEWRRLIPQDGFRLKTARENFFASGHGIPCIRHKTGDISCLLLPRHRGSEDDETPVCGVSFKGRTNLREKNPLQGRTSFNVKIHATF